VSDLTTELHEALGDAGFLKLTDTHGGIRLYVPKEPHGSTLASEIGIDNAARLSKMFSGGYIRVPVAREFRARHYRRQGESNSMIARRLGLSETGVEKLFKRAPKEPVKAKKDPRQIEMF
jgi:hypothetical protein